MQDIFHRPQTLSAIHDKSSAWLGLGSSVFAMLRQKSLSTDIMGIVATLLYLLSICIIHTAFPGIFAVSAHDNTQGKSAEPWTVPTVREYQYFGYVFGLFCSNDRISHLWSTSNVSQMGFHVYDFLNEYNSLKNPPLGLANTSIYDILPSDIVGNASLTIIALVNITSFNVDCTYLSGATLQTNYSALSPEQGIFSDVPSDVPFTMNLDGEMTNKVTLFPMRRSITCINTECLNSERSATNDADSSLPRNTQHHSFGLYISCRRRQRRAFSVH